MIKSVAGVKFSCLCGAIYGDGSSIQANELPAEWGYCHCDDCRYQIGGLFAAGVQLKGAPNPEILGKCTQYMCSESLVRYFCSTCGSFCFIMRPSTSSWVVGEGCVDVPLDDPARTDVMRLTHHFWAGDTRDYKLVSRLLKVGGRDIPVYARDADSNAIPMSTEEVSKIAQRTASTEPSHHDQLEARCHCGGVDLRLSRPDWRRCEKMLIPPDGHKHKFHANFCACRDCRKADGGASISPWMDVPVENLGDASGKQVTFSLQGTSLPGLLEYESTKGEMIRGSCKVCGARVFFWGVDKPDMCLLAPGLLRAPEGAAASNWVRWRCAISRPEEATDREIVEAMLDDENFARTQ